MSGIHTKPADIERTSMAIIGQELAARGVVLPRETEAVVKRVIHTTADFDYVENLRFTPDAVAKGVQAMRKALIVTDTNMACAGISKPTLARLDGEAHCFMAEPFIADAARERGTTRAAVSMDWALREYPHAVLAVGNAPTALLRIAELIAEGKRPALVVGVPVGFVNVVESKERLLETCLRYEVPAIVAMGRKGGSNVAAAICNALLYTAADTLNPTDRGWQ
jgi:precorrin-8X/cobalt-precorrin-8 methylmutase